MALPADRFAVRLVNRLRREAGRYRAARGGNIAIMFVFMLGVLMLFAGGAVDYTRYNMVRADLVESLDAAGLAIAQIDALNGPEIADKTGADRIAFLKEQGRNFFHENFKHEGWVKDLNVDFEITTATIAPQATGQIKTLFLHIGESLHKQFTNDSSAPTLAYLDLSTDTEITRRGSGKIELALVLDVTGSMGDSIDGKRKIASLRDATEAMLDTLYGADENAINEFARTAVVPFNKFVNPGKTAGFGSESLDDEAEAYYHGAHFLHVDNTGAIDLDTKVNHLHLFDSNADIEWKGCVLERPYPLDEMDTPPGSTTTATILDSVDDAPSGVTNTRTLAAFNDAPDLTLSASIVGAVENSRWVPYFNPDGVNCNDGSSSNDACGYSMSPSSQTRNSITYSSAWFDDPDEDADGSGSGTSGWPSSPTDTIDNIEEGGYTTGQGSWIDDRRYTRFQDANLDRYLPVVNHFRKVLNPPGGGSCPWSGSAVTDSDFVAWLAARGANECGQDEFILRHAYVGQFDPATSTYLGKYDLTASIDESITEGSDETMRGPNDDCPSPILPQTTSKKTILDFVNTLAPNGNTNSAAGAMWGWRVLSPGLPFNSDIAYDNQDWQKAVVIMTDGNNTATALETHWGSEITTYGYAREKRMGATIDTAPEMRDEYDDKLIRICTRMKQQGILVYSIIFGLDESDTSDAETAAVFKACATQPNAPYYWNAPDGEDLEEAFGAIAKDLVDLHVSK